MKTYLVAWSGDVPGAKFVHALGAADACFRIDFFPDYLSPCGGGTWTGFDRWSENGLAVVEVQLNSELDLDMTETIAVLLDQQGRRLP